MSAQHLLIPYKGIDDIRFGMTLEQVTQVLGTPDQVRHEDIVNLTFAQYGASEFKFDDDTGTLIAILVYKPGRGKAIREQLGKVPYVPVFHDEIEILDKDGFELLCEREQTTEGIGNTGVLFPKLGFLVTGFRKRVPEGRYLIEFPQERLKYYEELWLNV